MPIYQQISDNIQEIIIDNPLVKKQRLHWVNIVNPRKKEIEFLRKKYKFSLPHLQASSVIALSQRPRLEKLPGYIFMILHFPVIEDQDVIAGEIEFFVGPNYIITLHKNNITALNQFFNLCKKDGESLLSYKSESAAVLLYEILMRLVQESFDLLDNNSSTLIELEKLIFAHKPKKAVSSLLDIRRNVINTKKIMQNHKNIIKNLFDANNGIKLGPKDRHYYQELVEQVGRFGENLDNQKEMVDILNSTNESLMNYRISDIMKTLTIFSVIVFPLTLLAAIFGMNTTNGMPFMHMENGFWVVMAIMLTGCLIMILVFSRKRWL